MTATAAPPAEKATKVKPTNEAPAPAVKKEERPEDKVLDLTALSPSRRIVKLPTKDSPEGEQFQIRLLDDFGVRDQQQILVWSRRYDNLYNRDPDEADLTDDQANMLKFYLDRMFDLILDAPKDVKRDMSDALRQRVVQTFSVAPLLAQREQQAREQEKSVFGLLVKKGILTQDRLDELIEEADRIRQNSTTES